MSTDRSPEEARDRPIVPTTTKRVVVFESVTSAAIASALDGLALRQRTIANNIANVNTPGYHAKRVAFEDALVRSVRAGDGAATATTERSLEPTRLNGNNVNLDTETLSNIDTVLRYQFAAQAVNGTFTGVRTALRTS
ncbi:MAG: flagellar basal body rod protein FlgB [Cryobacterium sp.]|nr:flagellar basal body rod protein FlgB [Cryobacterium sp.]